MDGETKSKSVNGGIGSPNTRNVVHAARPEPVDADPASRPGVPMINPRGGGRGPGQDLSSRRPFEQQQTDTEILMGVEVPHMTPVFGTMTPPKGLSGVIRRRAYDIPEHSAKRWMLLILADRVDVMESRVVRHPVITAGVIVAGVALWQATRRRPTRVQRARGFFAGLLG